MELTREQFNKIKHLLPTPRKKPSISNYDFMKALLYIIENGCKWRALPKEFGNWHTIYVRFNRWSKNGVMERVFDALQKSDSIDVRTDVLCLDSTSIKVHPDAAGARRSSGEQSIGRSKGGSQQRSIWLPLRTDTPLCSTCPPETATTPPKDEN